MIKIPRLKKLVYTNDIYMERVLPVEGVIYSGIGDELKPYDHIGNCNVSHSEMHLPKKLKTARLSKEKKYIAFGSRIGKLGKEIITAPFNGHLIKNEKGGYTFREIESKYTLLSGVWGKIEKIKNGRSVLLKTSTVDIQLVAATDTTFSGELIVFPNPWHTLEKYYLNEFSASAGGKIIYVGNSVDIELLKEAIRIGVGGIIAGSCDKDTFAFAKAKKMNFGIFSGFGNLNTPKNVFDYLKTVSNRFVFLQGERNLLRVPVPEPAKINKNDAEETFVEVKQGMEVFILEKNYFGQIGEVDIVGESSIFVKLPKVKNTVEVKVPNFLALG